MSAATRTQRHLRACVAALVALLASACTMGPDYARPDTAMPAAWKELPPHKDAAPADAAPRGEWWESVSDPVLNDLEARVLAAN